MINYGEALKYQREINGVTQSGLAKATGISQQKISYYESGKHSPPIEDCIKLADFYGITLDELVGRDVKQKNN
jgi:DNA-binding protein